MRCLLTILLLWFICLSCTKSYKGEKPAAEIATIDAVSVHRISSDKIAVEVDITVKDTASLTSIELYSTGYLVDKISAPRTGHYTMTGYSWPSPVKAPYNFNLKTQWGHYDLKTFYLEY